jgi:hypothetical protein
MRATRSKAVADQCPNRWVTLRGRNTLNDTLHPRFPLEQNAKHNSPAKMERTSVSAVTARLIRVWIGPPQSSIPQPGSSSNERASKGFPAPFDGGEHAAKIAPQQATSFHFAVCGQTEMDQPATAVMP